MASSVRIAMKSERKREHSLGREGEGGREGERKVGEGRG